MTEANKQELINRLKSFGWRVGAYALLGLIALIGNSLDLFGLPPIAITIIGLALAELTKWLNNRGITIAGKKFGGLKK